MGRTLIVLVAFGLFTVYEQVRGQSLSGVLERWECQTVAGVLTDTAGITLTRGELNDARVGDGEVSVAEIAYRARFSMEGLQRRWDFADGGVYAFVISPDGSGAYYDFSRADPGERVAPSEGYRCRLVGARGEGESRRMVDDAEAAQREIDGTERRRREAEMADRMLNEYRARIVQRIESNWVRPDESREDLMWVVTLYVGSNNEVMLTTFEQFNGTYADRESIEAAIRLSSPLPAPPMPELFGQQLTLRFPAPD